ncbi:hypothetical protein VTG60DRAFT_4167 [Thermothelomyces hinnuleus]
MFKYAIFFAGWPPMDPDRHNVVLSDESDAMIEIPTCHIIGSLDPYVHGSMDLYNDTVKELGDVVRAAIKEYRI